LILIRLKESKVHFLADAVNHIWKFLIFSVDRIVGLNESTVEKKYEEDLAELSKSLRLSKDRHRLDQEIWAAKEAEYK